MTHRLHRAARAMVLGVGLLASVAVSRQARAQAPTPDAIPSSTNGAGFDTHLFRPAMDSKGLFSTNGTDILGENDISFGLVIDYAHVLLRTPTVVDSSSTTASRARSSSTTASPTCSSSASTCPIDLMSGGQQLDANGNPQAVYGPARALGSTEAGLPGLRLRRRARQVAHHARRARHRPRARPAGRRRPDQRGVQRRQRTAASGTGRTAIVEKRFGPKGEFASRSTAATAGHSATSTMHARCVNGHVRRRQPRHVRRRRLVARPRAARPRRPRRTARTSWPATPTAPSRPRNEAVGGIKLFVERNSYLMLGAGARYTNGFEAADMRAFLGFIFEPSIGDRDGDGIKDDVDKCPDEPEDFDGFQDEDGCPDPDNDNDGIPDVDDRCPNVPEDRDGDQDDDGCPEGSDGDRDGDGILDSKDKCPDEPEDRDGFQDAGRLPRPGQRQGRHPRQAGRLPQRPRGQGRLRGRGRLPRPGQRPGRHPRRRRQVPERARDLQRLRGRGRLPRQGQRHHPGQQHHHPRQDQVRATTRPRSCRSRTRSSTPWRRRSTHHPEFTLVEVAGHADERGDDQYNLQPHAGPRELGHARAHRRAASTSRASGARATASTARSTRATTRRRGRQNRRVEFKIVKTKDGPTGVELGCANATEHGVSPDPVP